MGFGDDVIVSSIVKKAYAKHHKKICVGDGNKVVWEEVFNYNHKMSQEPYPGCIWVPNIMGRRPYIDYVRSKPGKIAFNYEYRVEPGEIFFHPSELRHDQEDFIYIEPNVKGTFSGNKDWGFENWQEVVKRLPYRFIQGKGRKLDGVEQVNTQSFRDAAALLGRSFLFAGTDGGLHHAAAALGKRAVVVWGGLAPPSVLGYETHTNLHSGAAACGSNAACEHCKKALARITVEMVVDAIRLNAESWQAERVSGGVQQCA